MNKLDKLRQANAASLDAKRKQDEELARIEQVVISKPNPLSQQRTTFELPTVAPTIPTVSTFTRESEIVSVVTITGNKSPYFLRVAYDLIDPNPYNARVTYKPERIHKMSFLVSLLSVGIE